MISRYVAWTVYSSNSLWEKCTIWTEIVVSESRVLIVEVPSAIVPRLLQKHKVRTHSRNNRWSTVADLHSKILDARPPTPGGPNSFNFMQFFGEIWQNRMLAPPPRGNPGSATYQVVQNLQCYRQTWSVFKNNFGGHQSFCGAPGTPVVPLCGIPTHQYTHPLSGIPAPPQYTYPWYTSPGISSGHKHPVHPRRDLGPGIPTPWNGHSTRHTHPLPCGQTPACENITFPQLLLRPVIIYIVPFQR